MRLLWALSILLAVVAGAFYFATFGFAFTALLTLFAFGTVWFWGLVVWANLALLVIIDAVELRDDYVGSATMTFVLTGLTLHFLGGQQLSSYLHENLNLLWLYAGGYILIGIGYSFWKWRLYTRKQRRKYNEVRADFMRYRCIEGDEIPDERLKEWREYLASATNQLIVRVRPKASDYKKKIIAWGCYWPWSFAWSVLNDPVKRFFQAVFRYLRGVYDRMSEKAFEGTERDFREIPPKDSEYGREQSKRERAGLPRRS